jgi:hypothetical protein
MLMSSVLDPIILETSRFVDQAYHRNVENYLLGIIDNGVIVVDSLEKLKNDLFDSAIKLGEQSHGINSRILLEEILKLGKKKLVKALPKHLPADQSENSMFAYRISQSCNTDVFVTRSSQIKYLLTENCSNLVGIEDYSPFHPKEVQRRQLATKTHQIDNDNVSEFNTLIIGAIRFSKWLRFYDGQIGRASNNLWSFREGIRYVLNLYHQHGYFAQEPGIFVEVYTRQHVLDESAFGRLKVDFLDPLRGAFPSWRIRLFVKADPGSIIHARFLETQHAILNLDKGFDLYNTNHEFRLNMIRLDQDRSSHLQSCRELTNLYEET